MSYKNEIETISDENDITNENKDYAKGDNIKEDIQLEDEFVMIHSNIKDPTCETNSEILSSRKVPSTTTISVRNSYYYHPKFHSKSKKFHRPMGLLEKAPLSALRSAEARAIKMSFVAKKIDYDALRLETYNLQQLLLETNNSLLRIRTHVYSVLGKDLGEVEKIEPPEIAHLEPDALCISPTFSILCEEKFQDNEPSNKDHKNKVKLNAKNVALGLPRRFLSRFQRRSNELLQRISEINKESAIISRRFIQWVEDEVTERKKGEAIFSKAKEMFYNLHESRATNHKRGVDLLTRLHELSKCNSPEDLILNNMSKLSPQNIEVYTESWRILDQMKSSYSILKAYLKTVWGNHKRNKELIDEFNKVFLKRINSDVKHIQTRDKYHRWLAREIAIWANSFEQLSKIQTTDLFKEYETSTWKQNLSLEEKESLDFCNLKEKNRLHLLTCFLSHFESKLKRLTETLDKCQDARKRLVLLLKNNQEIKDDEEKERCDNSTLVKALKQWLFNNKNLQFLKKISSVSFLGINHHIWNNKHLFNFLIGGSEIFSLQSFVSPLIETVHEKRNRIADFDILLSKLDSLNTETKPTYEDNEKLNKLERELLEETQRLASLEKHWREIHFEALIAYCSFYQTILLNSTNIQGLVTSDSSSDEEERSASERAYLWAEPMLEEDSMESISAYF